MGEWAQSIWDTPLGHLGYPFPSNALSPHCPFAKIWGKWAHGTCGTPLGHLRYPFSPNVQAPICHGGHMQTFGEMDTGHLGYPFRKLGVAYPFPQMFIFPKCSIALVPIFPGAHLLQILIFSNSQFPPNPHLFRCPFAPSAFLPFARCSFASSAHLSQVSVYSKFSISPNAHLPQCPSFPQIPICPGAHFPQMPIAPSAQFSGTQMSGTQHLSGTHTVQFGPMQSCKRFLAILFSLMRSYINGSWRYHMVL